MGSFLKFGQTVLEIFELYYSMGFFRQKWGFLRQVLEGTYISEMAPKRKFLEAFCNFLGITAHNFVENDPKFENRSLFDAKFYGA